MKTQYDQSLCPILVPDCPVQTLDDVRWRVVDPFVVDLLPVKQEFTAQVVTKHHRTSNGMPCRHIWLGQATGLRLLSQGPPSTGGRLHHKWCVSSASSLWIRYPSHPQSVDCPKSVVVALSWRWLATSTVANPWPLVDHVGGSRSA